MPQLLPRDYCLAMTLACTASVCSAQTPAVPADTAVDPLAASYAGSYRRGSVDTSEQLVVLPDNTYCFAVMAGSLDLLSGGRWQAAPAGGTTSGTSAVPGKAIVLQEVKPVRPIFPAFAMNKAEQGTQVVFSFHGRSMSGADAPVFAVSSTDTPPKVFRRLFPEGHNGWAASYPLPAMDAAKATYFYIGHVERKARRSGSQAAGRLQITQYKLGDMNNVQLGFDRIQANPLMAFSAWLVKDDEEDVLIMDGRKFGRKRELSPKLIDDANKNCITPALYPNTEPARPRRDGSTLTQPVQDFYVNASAIDTTPWFELK